MLPLFFLGLLAAAVAFATVWMISVKVNNYGFLDVAWSYSILVLAPCFAFASPGLSARKWVLTIIAGAWSLRLGTYVLRRVLKHHPHEDPRYEKLRLHWHGAGKFLMFFELQAVVATLFALPFLFIDFDQSASISPLTWVGAAIAFLSVIGEAVADWQMQQFKAAPDQKGRVCERGLWRYSRHPNYFFESMVWCGFFLAALPSPYGWITVICPAMMLYFLFQVTGIPLTEEYSIRSKGDAYRAYQRTTSAFVPWFKKG
jgi:steroid 5-alpha reductase family enzyme